MSFFFLIREFLTVLERNLTSIVERPVSLLGNWWVILNSSLGREMLAVSKNLTTVSSVSSCCVGGKSVVDSGSDTQTKNYTIEDI